MSLRRPRHRHARAARQRAPHRCRGIPTRTRIADRRRRSGSTPSPAPSIFHRRQRLPDPPARRRCRQIARRSDPHRSHRQPLSLPHHSARRRHRASRASAIGAGLQVDTLKYYNQILELNVDERWVRVQPGIVLDELNAALRPHGFRFAPDVSTANRASIGGMMGE